MPIQRTFIRLQTIVNPSCSNRSVKSSCSDQPARPSRCSTAHRPVNASGAPPAAGRPDAWGQLARPGAAIWRRSAPGGVRAVVFEITGWVASRSDHTSGIAPIRGTDDPLNTLVFIRCRHPLALDMIPSNSQQKANYLLLCVCVCVFPPPPSKILFSSLLQPRSLTLTSRRGGSNSSRSSGSIVRPQPHLACSSNSGYDNKHTNVKNRSQKSVYPIPAGGTD
eukprot:COSAG01_NODE_6319_length_3737_cov_4.264156_4_plen_222_part_00